jgi:peptidoglycan/LPS O-acetylase OafA/YrhL
MERTPPQKLPALTALRFFAAALIVLWHSQGTFGLRPGCFKPFALSQAVSFFFVLSGFILAHAYPELKGWGERGRFLLARFARLWPAHVLALVLSGQASSMLVIPNGLLGPRALFLIDVCMLQSWVPVPSVYYSWNQVSWSISTEFAFYFFFLALIPNWRKTWHVKLALSFALLLAMAAVCRKAHLLPYGDTRTMVDVNSLMYVFPPSRLFEFVLGMATCLLWRWLGPRLRVGRLAGTALELAALGLAAVCMYYTPAVAEGAARVRCLGQPARIWLYVGGVCCLPFALLILAAACDRGWLAKLLAARPLVVLGEVSYSVYLFHLILMVCYGRRLGAFDDVPAWLLYAGYWVILLVGAHLIWALVERPARSFLVGLWPQAKRPPASSPAGKSARSFWDRLAAPGPGFLAAEAALLALLLAWPVYRACQPLYRFLDEGEARALAARSDPALRDVRFGDRLILRGAEVSQASNGAVRVLLVWESLKDQQLDIDVWLKLLNAGGAEVGCFPSPPEARSPAVDGGRIWSEKVLIPDWMTANGDHLALQLGDPTEWLLVDRGPRDGPYKLLLPLPDRQPPTAVQASRAR